MSIRLLSITGGGGGGGGSGDVVGPSSSVDNQIALFSGTSGKLLKAATGNGAVSVVSGVYTAGTLSIANGGTGQVTATTAFNALSPCTTKGDTMVHNGTNVVRLAIGNNYGSLVPDSSVTNGLKWLDATEFDNGNLGSSKTIDLSQSDCQKGTLNSATCAVTLSNPINGRLYRLRFIQDSTGSRRYYFVSSVIFENGTYSTKIPYRASNIGTVYLYYDGTRYYAFANAPYDLGTITNSYCMNLNGTSQYMSVTSNSAFSFTNAFSVCCWVNPSSLGARRDLVTRFKPTGNSDGWLFSIGFSGGANIRKLSLYTANASSSATVADSSGSNIATSAWTHVAVTFNGANAKFYQNGVLTTTVANTVAASTPGTVTLNVGASTNSPVDSYYAGKIDEAAVFNAVLTDADILDIYYNGLCRDLSQVATVANLQGWWRCGDQGDTTSTIFDRSGNTRDGTPQAFTDAVFVTSVF